LAVDGVDVGVTGEGGVLAEFVNQDATKASSNNLSEAHSTPHKSPMTHGTGSTANLTPELSPPVDVHTANGVPLVQTAGNSGGGYAMMCDLEEDVKQPAASDDGKQPLTQGSWKKPRSRRKKRPTSHCGALGNDAMRNDDDTSSKQSAGDSQANADFPAKNDGLDIEEDGAWNFLSTAEDQHIDRIEDADDTAFPQRETRSMQQPLEPMEVDDDEESDVDEKNRGNDQEVAIDDDYVDQGSVERDMEENDSGEPMAEEVEEREPHGSDEEEKETPEDNEKMEDTQDLRDTPSISFDAFVASAGSYSRSRRRRSEKQSKVRVMFTGVNVTSKHKQMIEDIGAELVEAIDDAATATHIIVNDGKSYKLRRTPKLMIGISKTNNIISLEWLEQSARKQRVLETEEFLYFGDEKAEERYNFSMKETIQNGITARRERGGVLGGWNVYICNGVAGNNAPSAKELHLIIESAGGRVIKSLSDSYSLNPLKTIIMTSDPSTISQRGEAGVARMTSMGTMTCVPQWLFQVIISQKLPNDDGEEFVASNRGPESSTPGKEDEGSHVSRMVRCNSHELLVSEISASPLKQRKKRMGSTFDADEILVRGLSDAGSITCTQFTSRDDFLRSEKSDEATVRTLKLWSDYFTKLNQVSVSPPSTKVKKGGVRCRRGGRRSVSAMVACTSTASASTELTTSSKKVQPKIAPLSKSLFEDNPYVTWEAYVLFNLGIRADVLRSEQQMSKGTLDPSHFFPRPVAICDDANISDPDSIEKPLTLQVDSCHSEKVRGDTQQVFGTLQHVFELHKNFQTIGMVPEQVISQLALRAIEAVSTMHECRVVHNDIGLDSFLVVKRPSREVDKKEEWFLQVIGFGYKSIVLHCHEDFERCHEQHFQRDYECLANCIHLLLTGGMPITLNVLEGGEVEFASKPFIKENLFLRQALSWCAVIDALLDTDRSLESESPFRLQYPLDVFAAPDADSKSRSDQIRWACRLLHDLSSDDGLVTLLDGLQSYNSRYILPDIPRSKFSCFASDDRQTFTLPRPNLDATTKEAKLKSDSVVLANRIAAHEQEVVLFKKAKEIFLLDHEVEQRTNLKREQDVKKREDALFERERAYANEMRRLDKIKENILLREQRLDERESRLESMLRQQDEQFHSSRPMHSASKSPRSSPPMNHPPSRQSSHHADSSVSSSFSNESYSKKATPDVAQSNIRKKRIATKSPTPRQQQIRKSSVPRPSDHVCSLQSLIGSPHGRRSESKVSSSTFKKRMFNGSPSESSQSQNSRKPKKVLINFDDSSDDDFR